MDDQASPGRGHEIPPAEFVEQAKQALEHLYDFAYLNRHWGQPDCGPAPKSAGTANDQGLRHELILAIESLSPGSGVPFRAPHARVYNLLHLHYVEKMTIQEAARELGISSRQAHRDLRRGEESVAAILYARQASRPLQRPGDARLAVLEGEMAHLETRSRPIDLRPLLERALKALERLALQRAIHLEVECLPQEAIAATDPAVAQQVMVSLLSHAVQQARPGTMWLAMKAEKEQLTLTLRYARELEAVKVPVVDPLLAKLLDRLGWTASQKDRAGNLRMVTLQMSGHAPTVLVIDDNEGLADLLNRYLAGHDCRVVAATCAQEGLRLAGELLPEVIVLDVMMPEMDGWEVLQRLQAHVDTAAIPIVVCSVFNDPELAYSLGASFMIPKPIGQDAVVNRAAQARRDVKLPWFPALPRGDKEACVLHAIRADAPMNAGNIANLEDLYRQLAARMTLGLMIASGLVMWWVLPLEPFPAGEFTLLAACVVLGVGIRRLLPLRLALARHLLIWGYTVAVFMALWLFTDPWLPFLGLVLIFAGAVLVPGSQLVTAAVIAAGAAWLVHTGVRAYPLMDVLMALAFGIAVAWPITRTLYTALDWAWNAQLQAQHSLEEARDHRGGAQPDA